MKLKQIASPLFAVAAAAGLAACAHSRPDADASATQQETTPAQSDSAAQQQSQADYHAQGQAELDKALEQLHNLSVFFEFDSAQLSKDAQDRLSAVADILVKHPELKVRIEGNADERGSEQYNLALGQRRADAAKKYLANLGVHSRQITSISFGAEKPKNPGHDEAAWKENRRDDVNTKAGR